MSARTALKAGVAERDLILKIIEVAVSDLEGLSWAIWGEGKAGVRIPLTILKSN